MKPMIVSDSVLKSEPKMPSIQLSFRSNPAARSGAAGPRVTHPRIPGG